MGVKIIGIVYLRSNFGQGISTYKEKWLGPESNQRHMDFQSTALPTELPSHTKLKKGSQNYPVG